MSDGSSTGGGRLTSSDGSTSYDVLVVGGGPAGCSVGVFTARYGLETCILDRGNSSIKRCAYLENYLGFPAGVDVDTFCALAHDHAREAGCEIVRDLVEAVHRDDAASRSNGRGPGAASGAFRIETQDGRELTANRVVAAAKYDAEYLRPLDAEGAMFETYEYDGEEHERFDRAFPDADGRTPIEGLYVAGPLSGVGDQVIISAGHGAQVGRSIIADARREADYWDDVAERYDWIRRNAELDDEWRDRDRWREWFDGNKVPDSPAIDDDRVECVREEYIDSTLATYVEADEIDRRTARGQRRIARHLDDAALLDAVDDDRIVEYARRLEAGGSRAETVRSAE
ncbi:FAD-dependent monooxygenase [Halegenticoccus tardaugens]|uniref:FAD-dependent monooxygenase n=1 Tax=Halegenticoccus tardaugens TaxID=2071624 RepID=UPI00100A5669|nr:FAD-dependent monooxygenase [Halegenticoccus tardaugens]